MIGSELNDLFEGFDIGCGHERQFVRSGGIYNSGRSRSHRKNRKAAKKKICHRISGIAYKWWRPSIGRGDFYYIRNHQSSSRCIFVLNLSGQRTFNPTRFLQTKVSGTSSSKGDSFYDQKRGTATPHAKKNVVSHKVARK